MNDLSTPTAFDLDPVSILLGSTYLPKWRATEQTLIHPWSMKVPPGVACLYVVISGNAWFQPASEQRGVDEPAPIRLSSGDHLVTTRGTAHSIVSDLDEVAAATALEHGQDTALQPNELQNTPTIGATHEAASDDLPQSPTGLPTRILSGQFSLSDLKRNPLNVGLPDVIHLNHLRSAPLKICVPMLDLIHTAQSEQPSGWESIVQRLGEMILLQTVAEELRRSECNGNDSGGDNHVMHAATDAVIGPVLRLMVDQPDVAWTVPQMARLAKVSKSAFSHRFRRLVGAPPLQYLTEVRMVRSRHLLRDTGVEISEIATLVGYESPSSFSNVFKRWHGMSPIQYRRGEKEASVPRANEQDTSLRSAQ